MQAINNRQSHKHCTGRGWGWGWEKSSTQVHIVYRSVLVTKDANIIEDMKMGFSREDSDQGRRHCGLLGRESTMR